jgi:hypothetical protein
MRDQLEARLVELEEEFLVGERRLREIDAQQALLRETLLRMSGAIQVLKELLESSEAASDAQPPQTAASGNGREHAARALADAPAVGSQ